VRAKIRNLFQNNDGGKDVEIYRYPLPIDFYFG